MRFAVSGASGLIGTALVAHLVLEGHDVACLVRAGSPATDPGTGGHSTGGAKRVHWDPATGDLDVDALAGCTAFVNLSGAPIGDRRLSPSRKNEVLRSRVEATKLLSQAASTIAPHGGVLVNASAVGIYGDRGDEELTEDSEPGSGFLADLCRKWEAATETAQRAGVRVVHLRTGIVLAKHGGALRKQLPLFRLGLGGALGTGRQWMSWISLKDEVGVIRHIVGNASLNGPVNAVGPEPATNAAVTRAIARAVHRPAVFRVPAPLLKAGFGADFAEELLLASQRVLPARLTSNGYKFADADLTETLESILSGAR